MFNTLGRFQGLNDEMGFIVLHSLAEYPAWQAKSALTGTAQQLIQVATGEGIGVWLGHTYGIIERFLPAQVKPMRAAQQQRWHFDFTAINRIHIPVALASMLLAAILFGHGVLRRPFDDLTLLAGTVTSAVLGNAFICAVIWRADGVACDHRGADRGCQAIRRRRRTRPLIVAATGSR
jgi:hypothetical protein